MTTGVTANGTGGGTGDGTGGGRPPAALSNRRLRDSPPRPTSLPAGWPLSALLFGFPVWWLLGMRVVIVPILAAAMAVELMRRRPIRVPPHFGLWLLFLVWFAASTSMLGYSPPRTLGEVGATGAASVLWRLGEYLSVTIALLYAGNLSERELPRARLVRMLGFVFLVVVAGGVFALVYPRWEMTSPVELFLPEQIRGDPFVQSLVHPAAAQVQTVLGYTLGRPAAPFGYTNMWGNVLSILLPWFVTGWMVYAGRIRRLAAPVILCVALVPAIYSLNRGLWIGLALSVLYAGWRLALRGRFRALGTLGLALAAGGLAVALSPLADVVASRLDNPHSNDVRAFTVTRTLEATSHSPVLGYGNSRTALGGADSIAIGSSPSCPQCGTPVLGSTGHVWLVLVSQGYVGAGLFLSFFAAALVRYGRDPSPIGAAGVLVVLLSLFYMLVYNALVTPLLVTLLSIALLWRNDADRGEEEEAAAAADNSADRTARGGRPVGGAP